MKTFFVIVKDFDKGIFSVQGPVSDDTAITKLVCDAQDAGRKINCESTNTYNSIGELRASVEKSLGLQFSEESVL
ncbi:hypothetical protein V9J82_003180 [Vibrio cholerae]|uniref:hypothetical protein n=1 Tax=Vibrio cholerae TaxID=666 RepID=UPI00096B795F|nr:hypothetical protein [Vibrio cholerae]MBO1386578.1 hypothetical protein [Vibrio cholerae]WOQ91528.1 hypothetical protein R4535_17555 [Vibrio cholerae]